MEYYIGIDLAWGEKNPSGFCVLKHDEGKPEVVELSLQLDIDTIFSKIKSYFENDLYVGIDAPLEIPNKEGNREIEKAFNKDFAKYKISMLPVNRKIMAKYSASIRSEDLFYKLKGCGFESDFEEQKSLFEVYPHATIAVCFNNYEILPYKRKKGRDKAFIQAKLKEYATYLNGVVESEYLQNTEIDDFTSCELKEYEDKLDAITSAYTLWHCKRNMCKFYSINKRVRFVTAI